MSRGLPAGSPTHDGEGKRPMMLSPALLLAALAMLARYQAVVFFTAINPPGVDVDGLVAWVRDGGAFVGIHSTANTYQGHPAFGAMLGARYDRRPWRTAEHPQTEVRVQVEDRTHPAPR